MKLAPATLHRGRTFQAGDDVIDMVNAALYLRRPLLVTGPSGSGKSSLIDAIAYELSLGEPLRWNITSRSTLRDALYSYDAVGRLQALQSTTNARRRPTLAVADFLVLGPLGTALLPSNTPRALLIDEIDKGDLDLPNDLLNVLENGEFEIPELARLPEETVSVREHMGSDTDLHPIVRGRVLAREFPIVVLTSNGERDFSPAFKRRCLHLTMPDPCRDLKVLTAVVRAHLEEYFDDERRTEVDARIASFVERVLEKGERLATDQLLNAVKLVVGRTGMSQDERQKAFEALTQPVG